MGEISQNNQKLSVLEKCAYGVGDMACNLFWGISSIALTFYTEYFGITTAAAGTLMLVVSMLDIAFDVVIGAVADRKKTKYGRFRPWILYGVVPFCVFGFFAFYTPEFNNVGKVFYASVTFLLFRLIYSVVNVPYGALMGVISADPQERTDVSAYRNVLAQCGCLLSYGAVLTFVHKIEAAFPDLSNTQAFSTATFIYAIAAFALLMFCFFCTRERVDPVKEENNNLSDDIKDLFANKPWICLTIAGIAMLFFVFVHNGLCTYYAKYCVANAQQSGDEVVFVVNGTFLGMQLAWEDLSSLLLASGTIITIIGTVAIQPIVRIFGKKKTWITCFILASVFSVCFLFLDRDNIGLIIILNGLFTLCIGPTGYIMWSMYADVADNAEAETGRRATGLIYSSATMAQKLGNTLANAVPAYALTFIGFVANQMNTIESIENLRSVFSLVPLIGASIGIAALIFYTIDEDKIKENSKKLAEMKANTESSDVVAQ